ncbi:hypothetical protein MZO42_06215 [Sphingomonas psychrotolerans]|uniref:Uncharacterized protein n=1 Tax=Sphingomonas psychrotolerans TaxID=1327635 RepID=A0ABU3N4P0_9SPHN|nr:hypothetical protein [Sphingomonas psychrotolerans]MDT8758285.1 hypothetical protein [Sphingomonas psychrotolerans]
MADPEPSERRKGRAAIIVIVLVVAIIALIYVTFNIAHYREMQNEVQAKNVTNAS